MFSNVRIYKKIEIGHSTIPAMSKEFATYTTILFCC